MQRELEPWCLEVSESGINKEKEAEGEGTGTEGRRERERENVFKILGCFAFHFYFILFYFVVWWGNKSGKGENKSKGEAKKVEGE